VYARSIHIVCAHSLLTPPPGTTTSMYTYFTSLLVRLDVAFSQAAFFSSQRYPPFWVLRTFSFV